MRRIFISVLCLISACAAYAQPAGGFGGWQMPKIDVHCSEKFADLDYVGDGHVGHQMDIYLPKVEKESYPVAIHIYGSAWFSNNSKGMADLGTIVNALLDAGYAVVTPNHRSSMDAKFPAQIHDIKAVVRYVRANAEKYKFDTDFIVTSGFSSGAHLASLAATSCGVAELEGSLGAYTEYSSLVDAACCWSGPTDLHYMSCGTEEDTWNHGPEEAVMGFSFKGNEEPFKALNATTYIDPSDPPVVVFHGTADNVVPHCQGVHFHELLSKAGVMTEFHSVDGGGHGMGMYAPENLEAMVTFLEKARIAKAVKEDFVPSASNQPGKQYPMVNSERIVRAQLNAPDAVTVKLDIGGVKYPMKRNAEGVWTGDSAPQDEGFHYYQFEVDGASVPDPGSLYYYGASRWGSGIEVPAHDQDFYALKNVPHGDIREVHYWSQTNNQMRHCFIYTPPGYDKNRKKRYPVLYLQHGGGENEYGWPEQGKTGLIMDNLIAEGKAEEFIIVMDNGTWARPRPAAGQMPARPQGQRGQGMGLPSNWADGFMNTLINDIIPMVDSRYRTIADRKHRAMAGLSMGGMQTKAITMKNPDVFSALGIFSGGIITAEEAAQTEGFKEAYKLVFLSYGSRELENPRYGGNQKEIIDELKASGVNAHFYVSPETAHEWQTWRRSLYQFAQLLFK
ncbi:MAG: prolyl oligopeptidase family serine peptidase [Bacteroidales bacterium]|nr:prolyl oligopeptidase family serine peptidase [Bacteroidales bacterium]